MSDNLFRKKSLDKIKEPEKLNAYIQAPKVHGGLLAVALFLIVAGFILWRISLNI